MSTPLHMIRANYGRDTIRLYQAYDDRIADASLAAQQLCGPGFSLGRMTWIKPSFLWLMHRSQWAQKKGQTRILGLELSREGWEEALSHAVLTEFVPGVHPSRQAWAEQFERANVHVQWDPERSLHGAALDHYSIQVGVSRHMIADLVERWTVKIEDHTALAKKTFAASRGGKAAQAKKMLPVEREYPLPDVLWRRLRP